jgi:SAM-dependent methyltransferase
MQNAPGSEAPAGRPAAARAAPCPVCAAPAPPLDVVDFSKSCEEARGRFLPLSGIPVYYHLCGQCGFCFAPEFQSWSRADFAERIYNAGYAAVDPDYAEARPQGNAALVNKLFGQARAGLRHLDYGGGSGLLSACLKEIGWNSASYDPFVDGTDPASLGQFDLVTAFEVFEHVPDVSALLGDIGRLMTGEGVLVFSTLLSDGEVGPHRRLTWWYAAPRNGHVSLFSRRSLTLALGRAGLTLGSFSNVLHVAFRALPAWASHLRRAP